MTATLSLNSLEAKLLPTQVKISHKMKYYVIVSLCLIILVIYASAVVPEEYYEKVTSNSKCD